MGARHHHLPRDRPQRQDGPARRQPPRPGDALGALRPRPQRPAELRRYTFLDDDSRRFYPDWDTAADTCIAILHTEAGRDPHDKALHDLVGELSTRSPEFRRRWSDHNVRYHGAGVKNFHHAVVGDLELAYESVDMISEPGLTLTIYAAEPASPSAHALDLLASWTARNIDAATQPT
jgi:MmyB-like transcription regulator ligand binding domain